MGWADLRCCSLFFRLELLDCMEDLSDLAVTFLVLLICSFAGFASRTPILAEERMVAMAPLYVLPKADCSTFVVRERRLADRTVVFLRGMSVELHPQAGGAGRAYEATFVLPLIQILRHIEWCR